MSEPVHLYNIQIVGGSSDVSGDMSAPITSEYTNLDQAVSYCIQAKFTGSPVGTIKLQASNDIAFLGWTDITKTITSITSSGTYVVNVSLPAYSWVQLIYTPISGSGTLSATINAKKR